MKPIALSCFLLVSTLAFAQDQPYYVVIGAFVKEENAQRYVESAHALNIPAVYAQTYDKKFYYVYVRISTDKEKAYNTLKSVKEEGYANAWVFQGSLENYSGYAGGKKADPGIQKLVSTLADNSPKDEKPVTVTEDLPETKTAVTETVTPPVDNAPPAGSKPFVFRLVNAATGSAVKGIVRLQEAERSDQFRGYNSNEKVYVIAPENRSGRWYLVCQVVGFKIFKKQLNFKNPQQLPDVSVGDSQEIIVPLKLTRVRRGDYIEMDEVGFFENSSILKPESQRELNELLAMMQENPDYKIRLHGHTNGDQRREIISLGQSTDMFALDPATNTKSEGSAKELSQLRADIVKAFLVNNGVEESRIATRGEGGKQMIFDPEGNMASANDRVEVEITKH
jgi:outer membrane protein OmpA-like peptidoglycan-associated protein